MKLELNDNELDQLKRLLCDFFIGIEKYKYESTGKVFYESMIIERYDFDRLFSMISILKKILTPEELIELENIYMKNRWGQLFPPE